MSRNEELFARAQRTIPAGVNSPVRAFRSVGGTPRFFARGDGAYAVGRRRQALHRLRRLLGAGDPRPRAPGGRARRAGNGARTGCRSARRRRSRSRWPRRCAASLPSIELVRLVSSGTEATMTALRLARGFTGPQQDRQIRGLLPRPRRQPAGEGGLGRADLRPAVVGRRAAGDRQRDARAAVQRPRRGRGRVRAPTASDIACIIVEPIVGNMNLIMPRAGVPARPARDLRPARRRADLRRGDDGLSRASARRAGPVRHHAGPDDARQGDRRRHAGGRVRRQARDHGKDRAARPGLPGRNAVGQSGGRGGGPRDAARNRGARVLRPAGGDDAIAHRRPRGRGAARRRAVRRAVGGRDVRPLFRAARSPTPTTP